MANNINNYIFRLFKNVSLESGLHTICKINEYSEHKK